MENARRIGDIFIKSVRTHGMIETLWHFKSSTTANRFSVKLISIVSAAKPSLKGPFTLRADTRVVSAVIELVENNNDVHTTHGLLDRIFFTSDQKLRV